MPHRHHSLAAKPVDHSRVLPRKPQACAGATGKLAGAYGLTREVVSSMQQERQVQRGGFARRLRLLWIAIDRDPTIIEAVLHAASPIQASSP